jgi:hypothetical protein
MRPPKVMCWKWNPQSNKIGKDCWSRHPWRTPVILATWEAEIRRIEVQTNLFGLWDPNLKIPNTKQGWQSASSGRVAASIETLSLSPSITHKRESWWGQALVAHICNPSYLGGWDWKDWFQVKDPTPKKKKKKDSILIEKSCMWWYKPVIQATVGSTK